MYTVEHYSSFGLPVVSAFLFESWKPKRDTGIGKPCNAACGTALQCLVHEGCNRQAGKFTVSG